MMIDKLQIIGSSLIQHGKLNNRVYIMKLNDEDFDEVIKTAERLCEEKEYTKIFAKVPMNLTRKLEQKGYKKEAQIPKFYNGKQDCVFLGRYFEENRSIEKNRKEIENNLKITCNKDEVESELLLPKDFYIRNIVKEDAVSMAEMYKEVFISYPFPIFDSDYLIETMNDNIEYAGIWYKNKLVSLASAETYCEYLNAEMTDFATLPSFRGNNFSFILLKYLEKYMIRKGYKTLYTIARARSIGMNITFKKCGYTYSGTLINNTNISGDIESMNVWYKNI